MSVELFNLTLNIDNKTIIKNINYSFSSSGISFLLGHNGAGKTQLLRLINQISTPSSGKVIFPKHKKQAMVFQTPVLLNRSCFDNLAFVISKENITKEVKTKKINQALDNLGLLSKKNQNALSLSGGQKKRLAIARCQLQNSDIFLLDEPSANIDISTNFKIEKIINELVESNKKVIMTTHDISQVSRLIKEGRDEIIILKKGRIVKSINKLNINDISLYL